MAKGHGHRIWIIPDGYMASTPPEAIGPSGYITHESVCILNDGSKPACCHLDVYFEDRDPFLDIAFEVGARRSLHFRLDKVKTPDGQEIPRDTCYSLRVRSDRNIVVQHSRLDVTQPNATLFTTVAYAVT